MGERAVNIAARAGAIARRKKYFHHSDCRQWYIKFDVQDEGAQMTHVGREKRQTREIFGKKNYFLSSKLRVT